MSVNLALWDPDVLKCVKKDASGCGAVSIASVLYSLNVILGQGCVDVIPVILGRPVMTDVHIPILVMGVETNAIVLSTSHATLSPGSAHVQRVSRERTAQQNAPVERLVLAVMVRVPVCMAHVTLRTEDVYVPPAILEDFAINNVYKVFSEKIVCIAATVLKIEYATM